MEEDNDSSRYGVPLQFNVYNNATGETHKLVYPVSDSLPMRFPDMSFWTALRVTEKMTQAIKEKGLEKEYCLLFNDKIMFHSPSKEAMEAHAAKHDSIGFTHYIPSIVTQVNK